MPKSFLAPNEFKIDCLKREPSLSAKEVEQLYEKYAPALYGLILRIVGDENKACTVLFNSFLFIKKGRGEYTSANGSVFAWMVRIALKQSQSYAKLTKQQLLLLCRPLSKPISSF